MTKGNLVGDRRSPLQGRPMVTAVVYVAVGVMPVYLTSAQVISLDAALGFNAARLGIATALYFGLAAAIARRVAGVVGRVGAQRGLRIGAVFSMCGSVAAATATSWLALLVAVSFAGFANAFMQVSTNIVLASDAAFHRQGMSFGAKQGAVPLASAVAGLLLPSVGVALGWRWPYAFAIGLAVVLGAIAPQVTDRTETKTRPSRSRAPLSMALTLVAFGGAGGGAAGNGLSLFLIPAAVDIGIGEAVAGTILAVGSLSVFAQRVAVGAWADRSGSTGHREMVALLIVGALASLCLAFVTSPVLFTVLMSLALLGSWGWPGLIYFSAVRMHPEATARASGVILGSNLTGTLIGPLVVGYFANQENYTAAWAFVSVVSALSAVFFALSWRAWNASQQPRFGSPR